MNKFKTLTLGALGLVAFACNVEVADTSEDIDTSQEAADCNNQQGVNAAIAAMAVAAANDMKRWLPMRDLECEGPWVGTDLHSNWQNNNNTPDQIVDQPGACIRHSNTWKLDTSPKADPRCGVSRVCKNILTLFQLQNDAAQGLLIAGTPLDVGSLRGRMESYWQRQALCQQNGAGNCVAPVYKWDSTSHMPVEYHELAFINKTAGTCGNDFNYHACKQNTGPAFGNTCQTLSKPASLVNNLMWAGADTAGTLNPYLAFYGDASYVKIDPSGGMVSGDDTMVGGQYIGCTTTTASLVGAACKCTNSSGVTINGTFKTSGITGIWKCKL